jgi:hypothetical protein
MFSTLVTLTMEHVQMVGPCLCMATCNLQVLTCAAIGNICLRAEGKVAHLGRQVYADCSSGHGFAIRCRHCCRTIPWHSVGIGRLTVHGIILYVSSVGVVSKDIFYCCC